MNLDRRPYDALILELLADGHDPDDVAAHLVDLDVAAGEYDGCSTELELAADEYEARARRLLELERRR